MSEWIKCTDGLPENHQKVIVWVSRFGYYPDYMDTAWRQNDNWMMNVGTWQTITHWMPLPEPPQ